MPAPQSAGIQTLMDAEREASETVNKARKQKAQRLKQAKEEADAEIEAYRRKKEEEFQQSLTKNGGQTDEATRKLEQETEVRLQAIQQGGVPPPAPAYTANKANVLSKLFDAVQAVDPKPHQNSGVRA